MGKGLQSCASSNCDQLEHQVKRPAVMGLHLLYTIGCRACDSRKGWRLSETCLLSCEGIQRTAYCRKGSISNAAEQLVPLANLQRSKTDSAYQAPRSRESTHLDKFATQETGPHCLSEATTHEPDHPPQGIVKQCFACTIQENRADWLSTLKGSDREVGT